MPQPRYLTKSRYKLALECPAKLYYTGKAEYSNLKLADPFLAQLADGGFQVGSLAQAYFPDGIPVETLDYEDSVAQTAELLQREQVTIFEAAFRYRNLFIRADIVVKNGDDIDLIEVKAKSCDFEAENACWDSRKGTIKTGWVPYIADVAFQKYVVEHAYTHFSVTPYLMLTDKNSIAATDGLNQKFRLVVDPETGRKGVRVSDDLTDADLAAPILRKVRMTDSCEMIHAAPNFESNLELWADAYANDTKLPPQPASVCKECEFRAGSDADAGLRCGFTECWTGSLGWNADDLIPQNVLDIWKFTRKDELIAAGKIKIDTITADDIAPKTKSRAEPKAGLDQFARQCLQLSRAQAGDERVFIDVDNLRDEFKTWEYPLHFIDFETSMPAIPFNAGRRPYEGVAFQFSHHTVDREGNVAHVGQYLDCTPGKFPNYDFVRALKRELENDRGTIFRYHSHENSYLCTIRAQLLNDAADIPDRADLVAFIESICQPRSNRDHPGDDWEAGPRNMVDLFDLVKRYYYHPMTRGSISLKYILPAIMNSSAFIRDRYSQPVYGTAEIPSLNFKDHVWAVAASDEMLVNPYRLLPPLFTDESEHDNAAIVSAYFDEYIRDGGAATTAYAKLQFQDIPPEAREPVQSALLKYCELDTLAMVMIYEAWRAEL